VAEPARTATVPHVLSASAETISSDLHQYGEDAAADLILDCTDEELVRVCSVAEWLLYQGPSRASGSMLIAKALSLAAVYVREGAPRELARSRRRRAESWQQPARTLTESRLARDQSSWPVAPRRSSTAWCRRSKTPASAHSRTRRQQVQPEP
jgi:hypothetical protein